MTSPGRISLKEAAARIGVHYETLRRWAKDGMISHWAIGKGGYLEFDPKEVDALIASFRRDRNTPPVV